MKTMHVRALKAYFRRFGGGSVQPSRYDSGIEGNFFVLRNVGGELARYRIVKAGGLRFVAEGGAR